jgi:hypothetical protein
MSHHYTTLDEALEAEIPAMASVVVGVSVSPSGNFAAALRLVPSAGYLGDYLGDELYVRHEQGWTPYGGGSGGGITWSALVDRPTGTASDDTLGVLRFGDQAPPGATDAEIEYEGRRHTVPVVEGYFLFVAWDTECVTNPRVLGFTAD